MQSTPPTVAAVVREQTHLSWSRARKLCTDGRVTVDGKRCLDPAERVPEGAVVVVDLQGPKQPAGPLSREAILFFDRDVVIVDKPAGMLSVPDVPGNKDTLGVHARTLLRRMGAEDTALAVVHRLDKDTSGPMAFARTATAQRALAAQFRDHEVDRVYQAIAHGTVAAARVETYLIPDRGDGLRGSYGHYKRATGDPPAIARRAITVLSPLASLKGATLVECRLETGRQHQIRIHLSELGHPLAGERVYIRDYTGAKIESPRPMLHAQTLGFLHPRTGKHVLFQREPPADFQAMLERLQTKSGSG
ncbi:hypothetical protein BWI17_13835 [Betaproteobacteria bacterium GR16-43]|nr:hypothetical protein BWI17_13835 [Betaproteobacteria bacterium GR16-43]